MNSSADGRSSLIVGCAGRGLGLGRISQLECSLLKEWRKLTKSSGVRRQNDSVEDAIEQRTSDERSTAEYFHFKEAMTASREQIELQRASLLVSAKSTSDSLAILLSIK